MKQLSIAIVIIASCILISSVILYLGTEAKTKNKIDDLVGQPYREIVKPSDFVNTDGKAVALSDYVGKKLILLEFMTYTCVNCQRSFPHLVEWHEKYGDKGLQIIGIHTPEYAFEREIKNVEGAMEKSHITFPVVLDNEYATWNAYGNKYWPRTFLIDDTGTIVYDYIGAGGYEETEALIKQYLKLD